MIDQPVGRYATTAHWRASQLSPVTALALLRLSMRTHFFVTYKDGKRVGFNYDLTYEGLPVLSVLSAFHDLKKLETKRGR